MPDRSSQHHFEPIKTPAPESITFTDAKKQMRIEHSNDDELIQRLINLAFMGFTYQDWQTSHFDCGT